MFISFSSLFVSRSQTTVIQNFQLISTYLYQIFYLQKKWQQ